MHATGTRTVIAAWLALCLVPMWGSPGHAEPTSASAEASDPAPETPAPTSTPSEGPAPGAQTAGPEVTKADHVLEVAAPSAVDVTTSDSDLGTTAHEIVTVEWDAGVPIIQKFRLAGNAATDAALKALNDVPGVSAARNSVLRVADDALGDEPRGSEEDNLRAIRVPGAWASATGAGVTVAVIDTGIDPVEAEIVGRLTESISLVKDGRSGDPYGHGTAVASIVGAALDGRGMAGVAPGARIMNVRVLGADGTGDTATVALGITRAVDAGANIINISLGGPESDPALEAAVDYARGKGVLLVAASGNDGQSFPVGYPAAIPSVLAVGSVRIDGSGFTHSDFAQTGPQLDIVAPGERIPTGSTNFATMTGTSGATPEVAGVAALMKSVNPALSPMDTTRILLGTARDDDMFPGRDDYMGYGMVQADKAVDAASRIPGGIKGPYARHRLSSLAIAGGRPVQGTTISLASTTQTQYRDGTWRPTPVGTPWRLQFRTTTTAAWSDAATGTVRRSGELRSDAKYRSSGWWRFVVQNQPGLQKWTGVSKVVGVIWGKPDVKRMAAQSSDRISIRRSVAFRLSDGRAIDVPVGTHYVVQHRRVGGIWRTVSSSTVRTKGLVSHSAPASSRGYWRFIITGRVSPQSVA